MVVGDDGSVEQSDIYPAIVHNRAKLNYMALVPGRRNRPNSEEISRVAGLADNIKLQTIIAQKMKECLWAWGLKSWNDWSRPGFLTVILWAKWRWRRKTKLKIWLKHFMIHLNGSTARFLTGKNFLHLGEWYGFQNSGTESLNWLREFRCRQKLIPKSLSEYLKVFQRQKDQDHFTDMSLSVLKLFRVGRIIFLKNRDSEEESFVWL